MRILVAVSLLLCWTATAAALPGDPELPFDLTPLEDWARITEAETTPYRAEGIRSELLASFRSPAGGYLFFTRTDNTLQIPAFSPEGLRDMFEPGFFSQMEPADFTAEVVREVHPGTGPLSWMINSFLAQKAPYRAGKGEGPVLVRGAFLPVVLKSEAEGFRNLMYVVNYRGAPGAEEELDTFRRVWSSFRLPEGVRLVDRERFNALRPELLAGLGGAPEALDPEPAPRPEPSGAEPTASTGPGGLRAVLRRALGSVVGAADPAAVEDSVAGRVLQALETDAAAAAQQRVWATAFDRADPGDRPRLAALFLAESLRAGDRELAARIADSTRQAGMDGGAVLCAEPRRLLEALANSPLHGTAGNADLTGVLSLETATRCRPFLRLLERRTGAMPLTDLAREAWGGWKLVSGRYPGDLPRLARDGGRWVVVRPVKSRRVHLEEVTDLLQLGDLLR